MSPRQIGSRCSRRRRRRSCSRTDAVLFRSQHARKNVGVRRSVERTSNTQGGCNVGNACAALCLDDRLSTQDGPLLGHQCLGDAEVRLAISIPLLTLAYLSWRSSHDISEEDVTQVVER